MDRRKRGGARPPTLRKPDWRGRHLWPFTGTKCNDQESLATISCAIAAGITVIDSSDFYGSGHRELPLGTALRERQREDCWSQY